VEEEVVADSGEDNNRYFFKAQIIEFFERGFGPQRFLR